MHPYSEYIEEIVSRLVLLDPYKIILFGSQASGTYTEDSDIDLFVILDSENVSRNYEEKMQNKLMVRNQVSEINRHVPIDLIVYTKAEYDILEENNVSFINEVRKTGKPCMKKKVKGWLDAARDDLLLMRQQTPHQYGCLPFSTGNRKVVQGHSRKTWIACPPNS